MLVREDGEAGLQASDRVDAVRVAEEAVIGEEVSLGGIPRAEDAAVGFDELVDIALLEALLPAAVAEVEKASRDAGGESEDVEEAHVDGSGVLVCIEANVWLVGK